MSSHIPVYEPDLSGREREYVLDCVDSTWISSNGKYISAFEGAFSEYTKSAHSIAVFNGTVALHLALEALGIGPGDEVLVPAFTYIASVNAILTTGATPVLVESRRDDWLMDVKDAEQRITPRTKAIMPVHLYGFACDMPAIKMLADKHGLKVVEDAAEAVGVFINGKHVGSDWSDAATFSFFGNKTLTCGEGGMVTTNNAELAEALALTKNHGMSPTRRYWHDRLGFNYRMTNIQAAVGLAQIERVRDIVARKKEIYNRYRLALEGANLTWQESALDNLESSYWLVSMLAESEEKRDAVMVALKEAGIDSRPVFYCAHVMPLLAPTIEEQYPIAEEISARGFSVPSFPGLDNADIERICSVIRSVLG